MYKLIVFIISDIPDHVYVYIVLNITIFCPPFIIFTPQIKYARLY